MNKPNIMMTRIDERLIHGQGQIWIKTLGCNTVLCVNDEVSNSPMQQTLMKAVLPSSIAIRFFTVQKTIDVINKANPAQKIFIIIKDTKDALELIKGGVPIEHINIGNIHNCEGKQQVTRSIFLDDLDRENLRTLVNDHKITFDTKTTPSEANASVEVDITKFI